MKNIMTLNEILTRAVADPQNSTRDGNVNWSFVDADLHLHEDSTGHTEQELLDALNKFADEYNESQSIELEEMVLCDNCSGIELPRSEMRCKNATDDLWICEECDKQLAKDEVHFEIDNTEGKNVTTILNADDVDAPENMTAEDRIAGLVNQNDLTELRESAQNIIDDLMDDGFDIEDIRSYLKNMMP